MPQKIRKAVVPAAGYGTRFLPVTKASPKEMMPVVNKPVIQYVIEELSAAGIEQVVLVTGWHKRAIEDHFDRHFELEAKLKEAGKKEEFEEIKRISNLVEFVYVRQKEMNGNGGAILVAKNIIGNEPFMVLWGDDFIWARPSRAKQLIEAYQEYGSVIAAGYRTKKKEDADKYCFVRGKEIKDGIIKAEELIEKPGQERAPSDMAVVSGFIFPPQIFAALESVEKAKGEELVWVDGVNVLKERGAPVYIKEIKNGRYYDCGNVLEYLKTNIEFALRRKDIGSDFKKYLRRLTQKNGLD